MLLVRSFPYCSSKIVSLKPAESSEESGYSLQNPSLKKKKGKKKL